MLTQYPNKGEVYLSSQPTELKYKHGLRFNLDDVIPVIRKALKEYCLSRGLHPAIVDTFLYKEDNLLRTEFIILGIALAGIKLNSLSDSGLRLYITQLPEQSYNFLQVISNELMSKLYLLFTYENGLMGDPVEEYRLIGKSPTEVILLWNL